MSSILSFLEKKQQELKEIHRELSVTERLLEEFQSCLNKISKFSKEDKSTESYQIFFPYMDHIISEVFDRWTSLEDDYTKLKNQIRSLNMWKQPKI